MLHVIHDQFGTIGSIIVALIFFSMFILWTAALAGIHEYPYSDRRKLFISTFFVLFPPYAIFWLAKDMHRQYKVLKGK